MKCEVGRTVDKFPVVGKYEPGIVSWSEKMEQGSKKNRLDSIPCPSDHQSFDAGKSREKEQNEKFHGVSEVSVLSPDPLVRIFLQGILKFQGFQCKDIACYQDLFLNEESFVGQVVFIEGSYLVGSQADFIQPRVEELVQKGVYFLILVEQSSDIDFSEFFNHGAYQILRKPLDYRKVGQAMAQVWSCSNDMQAG